LGKVDLKRTVPPFFINNWITFVVAGHLIAASMGNLTWRGKSGHRSAA